MGFGDPSCARLLELAATLRRDAAATAMPRYIDLMTRAAEELERFAVPLDDARKDAGGVT